MTTDIDPQTLQQLEHSLRMKETQLKGLMAEKSAIEHKIGTIRMDMARLENRKHSILAGPVV